MRTEEIYHRAQEAWYYDQIYPGERFYSEGRLNWHRPSFLEPLPEHLIGRGDERTEEEKVKAQDEYLKKYGL